MTTSSTRFSPNEPMRVALELAQLDRPDLLALDAGAGTGFTTTGIVEKVDPKRVTMLDRSPHQLEKAKQKSVLNDCFESAGGRGGVALSDRSLRPLHFSGEHRVLAQPPTGDRAPLTASSNLAASPRSSALKERKNPLARWLSDTWMLFPPESDYIKWYEQAGFIDIRKVYVAPEWYWSFD